MNAYEYIEQHAPNVLRRFIDEMEGIAVAALDNQSRILACNARFAELANLNAPEGTLLSDFASPGQEGPMMLPPEGAAWNMKIRLTNRENDSPQAKVQVFCENGNYFLFCNEALQQDDSAMTNMARLNDELSDLNRELEKKTHDLQQANKTIEHLARTDVLTELPNRRHFQEQMESVLAGAQRHDFPVAIAMGDLDHFKTINDTFGHDVGDEVLVLFAQILKNYCRTEDIPARWGGEEFIILMPHTAVDDAQNLAERVRQILADSKCQHVDRNITASFGVTQLDAAKDDAKTLIARADDALYTAKENGRNQIVATTV